MNIINIKDTWFHDVGEVRLDIRFCACVLYSCISIQP